MSQKDYDQGYEDGRKSRDSEVKNWSDLWDGARADLAMAQAEVTRLRAIVHRVPAGSDTIPF